MLFHKIEETVRDATTQSISLARKETLQLLIDFIQEKATNEEEIRLNFICTHNSRRSHLAQVWAQLMAFHFNIRNVFCYSGGTEATALFPMVAKTLSNSGFDIEAISENKNPVYSIKYTKNQHPIIGFSKKFDDRFNPTSGFAAILTCGQADLDCPFIAGAEKRIPMPFEDPKIFDNTSQQTKKYQERSLQIAAELAYVFSQINS